MDHSHNERQGNESRSLWCSRSSLTLPGFLAIAAFDRRWRERYGPVGVTVSPTPADGMSISRQDSHIRSNLA